MTRRNNRPSMTDIPGYALLGRVNTPAELRLLPEGELTALAVEMRRYLIETLGRIGGHFAANLGTVELSIALHRVFDTPHDRLVWDVGHQAYPHKMLTGRRARLETIRKHEGLAPFLQRGESEFDAFGAGHSSTSLSAAAGMAAAAKLQGQKHRVVAVIGDGGMSAGMAFEALNHLGHLGLDVLVVYNDNDMSISENVGALRDYSARLVKKLGMAAPHHARAPRESGSEGEDNLTHLDRPGSLFETLGFKYHGPVDGHDLGALRPALERLKDAKGPQLLHVITVKGKGFDPAEADPIAYHGVTQFDPVTGAFPARKSAAAPSYTQVFGDWLCDAAERNPKLVAITPAMREGSGLVEFAQRFPSRYFDVGIAEQHSVTLAAGMACEGLKPVVAIYSTFLQRAYDQLIHDVAIQNLPVLFALDRGGLVGGDGATHNGAFDYAYLRTVPNLTVMAPSDADECRRMLYTGFCMDGPAAVRYPRGAAVGEAGKEMKTLPVGRGEIRRRGKRVAILAFGSMLKPALDAAAELDATVANMRFVKPVDADLVRRLAEEHELLVTVEEHQAMGGAGSAVCEALNLHGIEKRVVLLGLPDRFIDHGDPAKLLASVGLDAEGIRNSVRRAMSE